MDWFSSESSFELFEELLFLQVTIPLPERGLDHTESDHAGYEGNLQGEFEMHDEIVACLHSRRPGPPVF